MKKSFFKDDLFTKLSDSNKLLTESLINRFKEKGYLFELEWRDYEDKRKQFTLKNLDSNYNLDVLITPKITQRKSTIYIEVRGGKYNVHNKFPYTMTTSEHEINDLFIDVDDLLKKHELSSNTIF